jgi:putative transposase
MGRSRYRIYEQQAPHFLTCTINNWIPIFTRPATVQVILDALAYRQEQRGLKIYAFVILENHLHLVAQSPDLPAEISLQLQVMDRQTLARSTERTTSRAHPETIGFL